MNAAKPCEKRTSLALRLNYAKKKLRPFCRLPPGLPLHQSPSTGSLALCPQIRACNSKVNLLASCSPFEDLQTLRKGHGLRRTREMERTGAPNPVSNRGDSPSEFFPPSAKRNPSLAFLKFQQESQSIPYRKLQGSFISLARLWHIYFLSYGSFF